MSSQVKTTRVLAEMEANAMADGREPRNELARSKAYGTGARKPESR